MKDIEDLIDRLLRAESGARHEAADALRELHACRQANTRLNRRCQAADAALADAKRCMEAMSPTTPWVNGSLGRKFLAYANSVQSELIASLTRQLEEARALNQEREKGVAEYHPPGGGFAGGGQ